jgi:hypothetical protein
MGNAAISSWMNKLSSFEKGETVTFRTYRTSVHLITIPRGVSTTSPRGDYAA